MLDLRKINGPETIAIRCIQKLKGQSQRIVFIDGIRSLSEVEEFKKYFPNFFLVTIHASPKTRYQRLIRRKRSDDPTNWEKFMERDLREIGIGIGAVISITDYMIVNEGTIKQLKQKILRFIRKVIKDE
jgi:dephospho-CoA kinase